MGKAPFSGNQCYDSRSYWLDDIWLSDCCFSCISCQISRIITESVTCSVNWAVKTRPRQFSHHSASLVSACTQSLYGLHGYSRSAIKSESSRILTLHFQYDGRGFTGERQLDGRLIRQSEYSTIYTFTLAKRPRSYSKSDTVKGRPKGTQF